MQEIETIKQQIAPVLIQERNIAVISADGYGLAAEFLKEVKAAQSKVTAFFGPMKSKAHAAWKEITAKEKGLLDPLKNAESSVKGKMLTFQREENRKAEVLRQKLQAEAEARAETERNRLLDRASKLKTPELQEQLLQEAEEVEAPVITVQSEAPQVKGISTRKIWKARVVDKEAFLRDAIKDKNLQGFIIIDEKGLNKVAEATKGQIVYRGIEFYQKRQHGCGE